MAEKLKSIDEINAELQVSSEAEAIKEKILELRTPEEIAIDNEILKLDLNKPSHKRHAIHLINKCIVKQGDYCGDFFEFFQENFTKKTEANSTSTQERFLENQIKATKVATLGGKVAITAAVFTLFLIGLAVAATLYVQFCVAYYG